MEEAIIWKQWKVIYKTVGSDFESYDEEIIDIPEDLFARAVKWLLKGNLIGGSAIADEIIEYALIEYDVFKFAPADLFNGPDYDDYDSEDKYIADMAEFASAFYCESIMINEQCDICREYLFLSDLCAGADKNSHLQKCHNYYEYCDDEHKIHSVEVEYEMTENGALSRVNEVREEIQVTSKYRYSDWARIEPNYLILKARMREWIEDYKNHNWYKAKVPNLVHAACYNPTIKNRKDNDYENHQL